MFALVALLWVDQTDLGEPLKWVVRLAFAVAPILMPLGFFLSITRPDAERPNGVIALVYAGGLALAVGALNARPAAPDLCQLHDEGVGQ